jgi:hypothetical protein
MHAPVNKFPKKLGLAKEHRNNQITRDSHLSNNQGQSPIISFLLSPQFYPSPVFFTMAQAIPKGRQNSVIFKPINPPPAVGRPLREAEKLLSSSSGNNRRTKAEKQ